MKKIKYPRTLAVDFDKPSGQKLDTIAIKERCSRPSVVLKAIDYYFAHSLASAQEVGS